MARKKRAKAPGPVTLLQAFGKTLKLALDVAEVNPDAFEGMHEHEGNPRTLAPRVPEAADQAEKMLANSAAAAARWKAGMMRPKKDPVKAAIAAKGKYKEKLTKALAEGRYEKGLAAVDEEAMLETIEQTPDTAASDGLARRARKVRGRLEKMRPMQVALAETIDAMPQDTDQQRIARMLAAREGMIEIGKRMKV